MKLNVKCASMIGELNYLGKHIYLVDEGVTLCGCFTVDYNKQRYKNMPEDLPSKYELHEWDITCERCLNLFRMIEEFEQKRKKTMN